MGVEEVTAQSTSLSPDGPHVIPLPRMATQPDPPSQSAIQRSVASQCIALYDSGSVLSCDFFDVVVLSSLLLLPTLSLLSVAWCILWP